MTTSLVNANSGRQLGWWVGPEDSLKNTEEELRALIDDINSPLFVVKQSGDLKLTNKGTITFDTNKPSDKALEFYGYAAPTSITNLCDQGFCKDHGIKYAYVGGSMAHGIASPEIAVALGKAGMIGFIGAAGDPPAKVEQNLIRMKSEGVPFGFNLIHSPAEAGLEDKIVDLYLKYNLHLVEASAFLQMTLPLVRYRVIWLKLPLSFR